MVAGVLLFLLLPPILLLVAMTYVRVLLEIVIVLFGISENITQLVRVAGEPSIFAGHQSRRTGIVEILLARRRLPVEPVRFSAEPTLHHPDS